jgi:hypothetical protein
MLHLSPYAPFLSFLMIVILEIFFTSPLVERCLIAWVSFIPF